MWGVLCHVLCDGSCVGWCAIRGVGCDMFVACEVACCVDYLKCVVLMFPYKFCEVSIEPRVSE